MSSSRPAMKKAGVKPNEVTYNTVINAHAQKGDPEGVSVPPMRMAGAQWGSAFFSPWYVSYSRFPPRRKSRMAELAGCQSANEFPGVLVKRLVGLVEENPSNLTPEEWTKFASRAETYKTTRFRLGIVKFHWNPFYLRRCARMSSVYAYFNV